MTPKAKAVNALRRLILDGATPEECHEWVQKHGPALAVRKKPNRQRKVEAAGESYPTIVAAAQAWGVSTASIHRSLTDGTLHWKVPLWRRGITARNKPFISIDGAIYTDAETAAWDNDVKTQTIYRWIQTGRAKRVGANEL